MGKLDTCLKKILVVEDEPNIGSVCSRVLTGEGFEVDIAPNGKVAQEIIDKKRYDICLIDIRTPAMDGKELYHWLEEEHPQLLCRVIFTTGDVMGGNTGSFLEQATRPLLVKPFTTEELVAVVKKALQDVAN